MEDWRVDFYEARWHLDVAKRMFRTYDEYSDKRFLIGVIKEAAKASGKLVRAFLILDETKGNLKTFQDKVACKYLEPELSENLIRLLDIERAQRVSRVEFAKGSNILLESDGNWKVLRVSRLREFVNLVEKVVLNFPTSIKRN